MNISIDFCLMLLGIQQIAMAVKSQIEDFKPSIPLIQALRAPGMRNRHWEEVCSMDDRSITHERFRYFSYRNWLRCLFVRRKN